MFEIIINHPLIVALLIFIVGCSAGMTMANRHWRSETSRHNFDVVRPSIAELYRLLMLSQLDIATTCYLRARDKADALYEEMAMYRTLANRDKKIEELSGENTGWANWLDEEIDLSGCCEPANDAADHVKKAREYRDAMNKWGNNSTYDFVFKSCERYANQGDEAISRTREAERKFSEQRDALN